MGLEILTELLSYTDWEVNNYILKDKIIYLELEKNSYPICPKCGQSYMHAPKDVRQQVIEELPIWGKRCYIKINKYRINCSCGFKGTEEIDFLENYSRKTKRYQKWIYIFCKRMTGLDVARIFSISKQTVYKLDKEGIKRELSEQKDLYPSAISVDEISTKKGHNYATIIAAPNEKKILDVLSGRKKVPMNDFFRKKGENWCKNIISASMDAWLAFRRAVQENCENAIICFDHFHLAQHFSKAIDKLRIKEARKAGKDEKDIYKGTRWLLLRRPEKLKADQKEMLDNLLDINKSLYTAYLLRNTFRQIFHGPTARSRLIRLTNWIKLAKQAKIPEITEFVKKIERWEPYVRNSLRLNNSNSFSEGLNNKIRVIQRMAYGYKDFDYLRLKIIQQFNFRDTVSIYDT